MFRFRLTSEDPSGARAGRIETDRGEIATPVFMPVGTSAAVRCLQPRDIYGAEIILANTYHLFLQPGVHVVRKAGGLHRFMGWDRPILTDSGGFQVFSLPKVRVSEEGVEFAFRKGRESTTLSPESSMEIQLGLGSDVLMAFDECLPYPSPREAVRVSVARTARWAERSKKAVAGRATLLGIVQGGTYGDLRAESARRTVEIGFDGYAVGGVSVGEGTDRMLAVVEETVPLLPKEMPRYVMGVGKPREMLEAVRRGVDMFDCVIPTRHGRSGILYTSRGRIRVTKRAYRLDLYPPDPSCPCPVCGTYTRAYLHHLFRAGEILGKILGTLHNVAFFTTLMARAREAIGEGRFDAFCAAFREESGEG
jgi:queuine tRNA-ribosyltransferase